MFFRLTYEARNYRINVRSPVVIHIGGPHNLSATIEYPPDGDGSPTKQAILIRVLAEFAPPRKADEALRDLMTAYQTSAEDSSLVPVTLSPGEVKSVPSAPFAKLPNPLKVFSNSLYSEMADVATNTFELLRWRLAVPGPVRSYMSRGFEWSDDREIWQRFPHDVRLRATATIDPRISPGVAGELESMITSGAQEPLAHSLLREAVAASTNRNWASALVMAVTALEIGTKQLIAVLVPQAAWLAEHLPSPPIDVILREYLPTMPARCLISGEAPFVPDGLLKIVKKGVTVRNSTIHAGKRDLDRDLITDVIAAVSDILWILDVYAGNKWALTYITPETRTELLR
jgi:hypothetical protein